MPRIILLLVTLILAAGCAARGGPAPVGDVYDDGIAAALAKAGDNAPELRAFLDGREPGGEQAQAARFLVAGLPLRDAAVMTALDLAEHLDYAFRARQAFPWCADMPWDVFLRFVIPHRVAQERAQPWRKRLFETLRPEVLGLDGPGMVALAVNRWVARQAAYGPTARVDQGPLDTMARGLGRCEELVILLVDALRAVGVAARPCGVSWWRHTDDNHVWVEVWDRGRWLPLGAGEVDSRPGLAWFSPRLHTAATVWSTAYGQVGPPVEGALAPRRGSVIVDRTADYVRAGTLDVELVDAGGDPVADARVYVSVWNYGALRPDSARRTDSHGRCAFVLGAGDYLVTTSVDGRLAHAFASVSPGEPSLARLRPLPLALETSRWMRFPADAALAATLEREAAALRRAMAPARREIEAARQGELQGLEVLVAACLGADTMDDPGLDTPLAQAMRGTGRNVVQLMDAWLRTLTTAGDHGREILAGMLTRMTPKDLACFRGPQLASDALAALDADRAVSGKGWYVDMDAEEYVRNVLASRVDREVFSHWRAPLWERFGPWLGDAAMPLDLARRVNKVAARPGMVERFRLGPGMDPLAVLRTDRVVSVQDRAVLAGAMLRSLGVPARMAPERDWVEFHDGREWLPMYPDRPAALGDRSVAEAGQRYARPARLAVRFTRGGRPLGEDEVRYWRDVTLCRFTEGGYPEVQEDLGLDWEDGRLVFTVPPGDWLLVSGTRGPGGQAFVRVDSLELGSGQDLALERSMDIHDAP